MKKWLKLGCALLLVAGLGACDYIAQKELRPGQSTLDEVRQLMGGPETIRERADGSVLYEYPRGPEGTQTWMVEIGPDGIFRGMTDALRPENLARVKPGMSRDQVREILGRPGETGRQPGVSGTVMSWRVQTGPGATEMFHVQLGPDGRVVAIDRSQDMRTINTR
jgi:hypothetical protein